MNTTRKIELRQSANELLSEIIQTVYNHHKDLRYIQVLWLLDIIDYGVNRIGLPTIADRFEEEPIDTLIRCLPTIQETLKGNQKLIEKIKELITDDN